MLVLRNFDERIIVIVELFCVLIKCAWFRYKVVYILGKFMKKKNPVVICIFEGLDENLNGLQFCILFADLLLLDQFN
jgi:hypothetical protein